MGHKIHGTDPLTLQNPALQVRCAPLCGGRISHFVPGASGRNQLHWDPPQIDPRQLTSFVPIGGWHDMLLSGELRFPGLHWNQPYRLEPLAGPAVAVRMSCEAGGVRAVRTVTVSEKRPAVTIATEFRNLSGNPFPDVHIRTQPTLRPGGRRTQDTAILWPAARHVDILTLSDSVRGAGRFAPDQRPAETNWWGCCDPGSGVSLLAEDIGGHTVSRNLVQDTNLLMLENIGRTDDLLPDDSRQMAVALHYYPLDLRPWVRQLGHSHLVSTRDWLIGIRIEDTELSPGTRSLAVGLTGIALAKDPPPREGTLRLLDNAGKTLREWRIELRPGADARVTEAVETLDPGPLALGDYRLVFAPAGGRDASTQPLQVVEQTQRQKVTSARRELSEDLDRYEERAAAFGAGHFSGAMVRHDLAAARGFLSGGKLDSARQVLGFVESCLSGVAPAAPLEHPHPGDLNVPDAWFQAIEGSVPELPVLSRHPGHYGTFHDNALTDGWHWRDDAQAAYALAWLYFHPSSRYHGQPEALCRAVLAVDELCRSFGDGSLPSDIATDTNISRFTLCPLGEALRILMDLPVAPARKEFWRTRYCAAADYQVRTYGGQPIPEGGYLNQDVMYLLIMRFAQEMSGDVRYTEQCTYILDMIESQLLPDGAFHYLYPHNEVTHYHDINITYLFRDWKVSGDVRSRRVIEKGVRYYPLMVGAGGWTEFSSQTWWKHTGVRWPLRGPVVVAGVTGDGHNQYIAAQSPPKPVEWAAFDRLVYAALAARDDVRPEPPPDHLLVLDRNVRGPRGRFGSFSWVGTTAPYRDTLVGCVFSEPARNRAYVMHYAGPQVLFGNPDEANPYLGGAGLAMSPEHYESDVVVKEERAALAARYGLFPCEHELDPSRDSDWLCEQLWYFDEHRMVGLMRLTARRETQARAIDLSVRFANYDAVWKEARTELMPAGEHAYAAGPLRLRVIAHNLESELLQDTGVCAYDRKTPGKGLFARTAAGNGRFKQGAEYHLLAEVRPHTSPVAPIALLQGVSRGFRVETGGAIITITMSETDNGLAWELEKGTHHEEATP